MFTGKAYRLTYDEEQKKLVVVGSDIKHEKDFDNAPKTNFEEYINRFHPCETVMQASCDKFNNDIKDGIFTLVKCKDCGMYFLISQSEREFYEERNLCLPKRCNGCRSKRKNNSNK